MGSGLSARTAEERLRLTSSMWIERSVPWIIAIAACTLLTAGIILAFSNRTSAAGTAWAFGFLLVILLLLAKFKRFKGFGFEAELWEQKQEEAAALVDQLRSLSKLVSKQMASVTSRLGSYGGGFSLSEFSDFLGDLQQQLKAIGIPEYESEEILQRLHLRIERQFLAEAQHEVSTALKEASDAMSAAMGADDAQEHVRAASLVPDANREWNVWSSLSPKSIEEIIDFVSHSNLRVRTSRSFFGSR